NRSTRWPSTTSRRRGTTEAIAAFARPFVASKSRIRAHLRRVEEEFLAPDEAGVDAQLHNMVEEAAEHGEAVALADAGEAGVVGQRLTEAVAEVPAEAESVGDGAHQLAFGPQPLEEQHQLQ